MNKQVFLDLLKEDRYDSTTRLVFADWLEEKGKDDEAREQRRMTTKEWIDADKWMHEFAESIGGTCLNYGKELEEEEWKNITYEEVMRAAQASIDTDGSARLVQVGTETARNMMDEPRAREQFWEAWQVITDQYISDEAKGGRVFCCTC